MEPPRLLASPYHIGASVSSVELLLDARTAAESAAPLARRVLAGALRVDEPLEVMGVTPGPAKVDGAMNAIAELDVVDDNPMLIRIEETHTQTGTNRCVCTP